MALDQHSNMLILESVMFLITFMCDIGGSRTSVNFDMFWHCISALSKLLYYWSFDQTTCQSKFFGKKQIILCINMYIYIDTTIWCPCKVKLVLGSWPGSNSEC